MDFALDARHLEIQDRARDAAARLVAPHARESDEMGVFRHDVVEALAREGFLGLAIPRTYGGSEIDHLGTTVVLEEFGRVDSSVRGFLTVHGGLVARCLMDWGSADQKQRWLPALASGEAIGCYCLTEREAGSDVASISTTATRDGEGWRLDGEKHWITNGNVAGLAIVFATVDPTARRHGISAFLVPTDSAGFDRRPMPGKELGHRGSDHSLIRLDGVRVPAEYVLGAPGEGFKVAMSALDHGRLGVAAGAVGVLAACLDACVEFARTRRQFGKRIGDFGSIGASLADMAADLDAARLLTYRAAWMRDRGEENTQAVSIAKLFATEAAARAASVAVSIHGARGYSSEYPVERFYRDIKGMQIYEGTSDIQRIVISRKLLGPEGKG